MRPLPPSSRTFCERPTTAGKWVRKDVFASSTVPTESDNTQRKEISAGCQPKFDSRRLLISRDLRGILNRMFCIANSGVGSIIEDKKGSKVSGVPHPLESSGIAYERCPRDVSKRNRVFALSRTFCFEHLISDIQKVCFAADGCLESVPRSDYQTRFLDGLCEFAAFYRRERPKWRGHPKSFKIPLARLLSR